MGDMNSIPPDPRTMAYLLSKFEREQSRVADTVGNIGKSIGSIETTLIGLNSRVKNLEKHDRDGLIREIDDATGAIDTNAQRLLARETVEEDKGSKFQIPTFIVNKLPWILSAALFGAAMTGYFFADKTDVSEDTFVTKDDIKQIILETQPFIVPQQLQNPCQTVLETCQDTDVPTVK